MKIDTGLTAGWDPAPSAAVREAMQRREQERAYRDAQAAIAAWNATEEAEREHPQAVQP